VRVGRACQAGVSRVHLAALAHARRAGVRRFHLLAFISSLGGCDPNIVLGARSVDEIPDVATDGPPIEDGTNGDAGMADSASSGDRMTVDIGPPDQSEMPDRADVPDRSEIPDRSDIPDMGAPSDRGPDLPPPTIVWFADHERGDLSSWTAGGAANGGGQYQSGGQTEVTRDRPRGGSYAAKLTIDTTDGTDHTARLYRRTVSGGAYYSAWFYFTQPHTPDGWWSIFLFRAQRDPNDIGTYVNLWNLDVERPDGGSMTLSFYNHLTMQFTRTAAAPPIPIGQWTHIEAFFHHVPPDGTRITVWQDGVQVFDLTGLGTPPATNFYWSIGNGSNGLIPRVSTIYIDDAAIVTGSRLGPGGGGGG
jgi:hypothetical protein